MTIHSMWVCPVCRAPLVRDGNSLACHESHRYDVAKQGYVNLLLANQKHSREPGDSSDMVSARRRFLAQGHYDFMVNTLCEALDKRALVSGFNLLDIGCGEGYYLRKIRQHFELSKGYAIDISKQAVKLAAGADKSSSYGVASSAHIPMADSSLDVVINIFSPIQENEVRRVMKPEGVLIRVSPGPDHFIELKQRLYADARLHKPPSVLAGVRDVDEMTIRRTQELSQSDMNELLTMTPLNWRGAKEAKEELRRCASFNIRFEFVVQVIRFEH